jgi:hypothetical protein
MHLLDEFLLGLVGDELLGALFVLQIAKVEPALEGLPVPEDLGQQKVQQRPQLLEVVLQGRAGDEKAGG